MSEPVEHHVEVVRTARYWTLGPEHGTTDLWMVLHGYKQLARRFLRRFEPIDDGSRRIVAPEGLNRFYIDQAPGRHGPESVVGATWMTREDREHEIRDYVRYLSALAEAHGAGDAGVRTTLLGFSQGVATAARVAVLGDVRFDRLVLWGDTLPPDLPMDVAARRLDGVEVIRVRGRGDRAVSDRRADHERERLDEAGIVWRAVTYDGGHDIHEATLRSLAG
ncbi:MAG: hypothetical protein RH859_00070 [Longimicrobiales bacterium]